MNCKLTCHLEMVASSSVAVASPVLTIGLVFLCNQFRAFPSTRGDTCEDQPINKSLLNSQWMFSGKFLYSSTDASQQYAVFKTDFLQVHYTNNDIRCVSPNSVTCPLKKAYLLMKQFTKFQPSVYKCLVENCSHTHCSKVDF